MSSRDIPRPLVRELQSAREVVDKVEVLAPKCVSALRLFTSRGQLLTAGQAALEAAASAGQQLMVSTKNREGGFLVAVRGWQDKPISKA
eukprot:gene13436-13564_t